MSFPDFRYAMQRLCGGVTARDALDDPALSLKRIFVEIAMAFNNEEVEVELPEGAYDIEYIHLLDPNDTDRIIIQRDRELYMVYYLCVIQFYYKLTLKIILHISI